MIALEGECAARMRKVRIAILLALVCILVVLLRVAVGTPLTTWLQTLAFWVEQSPGSNVEEPPAWSERIAPDYYQVVGPAKLDDVPGRGEVSYAPLDALGRAGRVVACVDAQLAEEGAARERQNMSDIKPSGWGNNEEVDIPLPDGGTYHGYMWNRSHLLAKSLGGQEIEQNLVCGTRMQNVGSNRKGKEGGMAYAEMLARDWLSEHPDGWLYYCATPRYAGNEPVCRCVVVDMRSSDGLLDSEIVVYNAAKGFSINYADGSFAPES